jgi:hypothetical protein
VTKSLRSKGELNLGKNRVVRGNPEMFPLLLELESEERYQQVSSLIGNDHEELGHKFNLPFL